MGLFDSINAIIANVTQKPKGPDEFTPSQAYAANFPQWEQVTPRYPLYNAWTAAQTGYTKNELVYACINKWAHMIASAPCLVYEDDEDAYTEDPKSPLRKLLRRPNEYMTEGQFWQATQINLDIAGFAPWEKEYNNRGEVIALWPYNPAYCSFFRGEGRPIAKMRYIYPGYPIVDIPIERILLFGEFDPRWPQVSFLSKTSVALRSIYSDNQATDMLAAFMQNGANISGLLKTQQVLNRAEAERIRQQWIDQHSGAENFGKPGVIGSGVEYQPTSMTIREMDLAAVDGRTEARICQVYDIPPIVVSAKVGIDRMTYSNYAESRKAWIEQSVKPRWEYYASEVTEQLVPDFYGRDSGMVCEFDMSDITALQEDRNAIFTRAITAAQAGILTRDEAREEIGYDPIDEEEPVFLGSGVPAPGGEEEAEETPMPMLPGQTMTTPPQFAEETATEEDNPFTEETGDEDAKENERKQYKAWLKRGARVGKSFKFKHHSAGEIELLTGETEVTRLAAALDNLAAAMAKAK